MNELKLSLECCPYSHDRKLVNIKSKSEAATKSEAKTKSDGKTKSEVKKKLDEKNAKIQTSKERACQMFKNLPCNYKHKSLTEILLASLGKS